MWKMCSETDHTSWSRVDDDCGWNVSSYHKSHCWLSIHRRWELGMWGWCRSTCLTLCKGLEPISGILGNEMMPLDMWGQIAGQMSATRRFFGWAPSLRSVANKSGGLKQQELIAGQNRDLWMVSLVLGGDVIFRTAQKIGNSYLAGVVTCLLPLRVKVNVYTVVFASCMCMCTRVHTHTHLISLKRAKTNGCVNLLEKKMFPRKAVNSRDFNKTENPT